MKKRIVTAVAVVFAAAMTGGCVGGGSGITSETADADIWAEYPTLAEAEEAAGFEITVPDMASYGEDEAYRVCAALSEIEIQYLNGEEQGAYIRKADDDGDISGDYEEYAYEEDTSVGENTVTFKGASEDEVNLAVWHSGDYAYCVRITDGVSFDDMSTLVSGVE